MTNRQAQLIDAEISRHISLALLANEPAIRRGHLDVAQALTAALAMADERRSKECKSRKSGPRTVLSLRGLLERHPGRIHLERKISREQ